MFTLIHYDSEIVSRICKGMKAASSSSPAILILMQALLQVPYWKIPKSELQVSFSDIISAPEVWDLKESIPEGLTSATSWSLLSADQKPTKSLEQEMQKWKAKECTSPSPDK